MGNFSIFKKSRFHLLQYHQFPKMLFLQEFYKPHNIDYLGLKMFDVPQTNISKYFGTASDFIENSLLNGGIVWSVQ